MVPWFQNPVVVARLYAVDVEVTFLLLGAFGWEYFQSVGVEYAIIRRRLPFRWPLIPYVAGRIFLLIFLLLFAIQLSPTSMNCQPWATALTLSAIIAMGCSSANLMIRTWVIWKDTRLVHMLLLLAALAHLTILILDAVYSRAFPLDGSCDVYLVHPEISAGVFVSTMCYDFLVFILSILKLSQTPSKSPLKERLRAQGLLYFAIAAMVYIPATVFVFLNSTPMVGMTSSFAMTASMIASCRAVRSLLAFRTSDQSDTLHDDAVFTSQVPYDHGSSTC